MNFLPLLLLALALNIGAGFADLWVHNLNKPDDPDYGGLLAFMPTGGGDSDHAYSKAVSFFRPLDSGEEVVKATTISGPDSEGLFALVRWGLSVPACYTTTGISILLGYLTFSYKSIDIIPNEGFANWIKTAIYVVGALITTALMLQVILFVIQTGVFQSPAMMIGLGVLTGATVIFGALTSSGAVQCGGVVG